MFFRNENVFITIRLKKMKVIIVEKNLYRKLLVMYFSNVSYFYINK